MENTTKTADLGGPNALAGGDYGDHLHSTSGFMVSNKTLHDIEVPPEKPNKEYYDEYCKLFINNYILTEQLNALRRENRELLDKYRSLEVDSSLTEKTNANGPGSSSKPPVGLGEGDADEMEKKRRKRKKKDEVERNFKCPSDGCAKAYGYSFDD